MSGNKKEEQGESETEKRRTYRIKSFVSGRFFSVSAKDVISRGS